MFDETIPNLSTAIISKQAVLNGLSERAEQLSGQLETVLRQIDEINQEINAIHELQIESSDDPETQDPPNSTRPVLTPDLEPVNHSEEE